MVAGMRAVVTVDVVVVADVVVAVGIVVMLAAEEAAATRRIGSIALAGRTTAA